MIRIGDFSKLSRVSVKTLRHYDEIGLLKPVVVDRFTSYRYYEFDQLARLYRILALKDLGFSLAEIGRLLENDLPVERMRGMLTLRQAEIRQQVAVEVEQLERVERWLHQLEEEEAVSNYDVVLKPIAPVKVASIRDVVPTPPDQGALWGELMDYLNQQQVRMIGPPMAIYHDKDFRERDWDIEVCMPIIDSMTPDARLKVYELPGSETVACVVHAAGFDSIGAAYDAIAKWIDSSGYQIVGPCREVILRPPETPGDQQDLNTLVEIQFPVAKA